MKFIQTGDIRMEQLNSTSIPIEHHFAGHYRLEYDGKYITLLGWDNNYPIFDFCSGEYSTSEFEEMVLVPCVMEIRNANPFIKEITDKNIIIQF